MSVGMIHLVQWQWVEQRLTGKVAVNSCQCSRRSLTVTSASFSAAQTRQKITLSPEIYRSRLVAVVLFHEPFMSSYIVLCSKYV